MAKFTKIVLRPREPGEFPTLKVAIRNMCLECIGYVSEEVEHCTAPKCWLFTWRLGETSAVAKKQKADKRKVSKKVPQRAASAEGLALLLKGGSQGSQDAQERRSPDLGAPGAKGEG